MITLFITVGSCASWFAAARYLFRRWAGRGMLDEYDHAEVVFLAMFIALIWPILLVGAVLVAGITHNQPKSRAELERYRVELEEENNRLRRQQESVRSSEKAHGFG